MVSYLAIVVDRKLRSDDVLHTLDELVNREIFYSLRETQVLVEQWRREYNTIRRTVHWATGRPPRRRFGPTDGGSGDPRCRGRDLLPD